MAISWYAAKNRTISQEIPTVAALPRNDIPLGFTDSPGCGDQPRLYCGTAIAVPYIGSERLFALAGTHKQHYHADCQKYKVHSPIGQSKQKVQSKQLA